MQYSDRLKSIPISISFFRMVNVNAAQACAVTRTQRSGTEVTIPLNKLLSASHAFFQNIESGLGQMNLGGERISRNRAPRTTTSSRSSKLSHLQPVRIQQQRNPGAFLFEFGRHFFYQLLVCFSYKKVETSPEQSIPHDNAKLFLALQGKIVYSKPIIGLTLKIFA